MYGFPRSDGDSSLDDIVQGRLVEGVETEDETKNIEEKQWRVAKGDRAVPGEDVQAFE